jgi:hypothetical protein
MFIGSSAIGLGAVAIAVTFRPPRERDPGVGDLAAAQRV